ncbi:peptidase family M48-domain-containing protein, partial [Haematococcus lacustris]
MTTLQRCLHRGPQGLTAWSKHLARLRANTLLPGSQGASALPVPPCLAAQVTAPWLQPKPFSTFRETGLRGWLGWVGQQAAGSGHHCARPGVRSLTAAAVVLLDRQPGGWGGCMGGVSASSKVRPAWQGVRSAWTDARGVTHFRQPGWAGGGLGQGGQLLLVLAALGAAGYYWSCLETIPYTGRRHAIMLVSRSSERAMGRAVYDQQCQEAAAQHALLPAHHPYSQAVTLAPLTHPLTPAYPVPPQWTQGTADPGLWGGRAAEQPADQGGGRGSAGKVVRRVGLQVARVAADGAGGGANAHMKDMDWEFAVIRNPTPNAFVVPGGKVVVFSGLLDMLASEEELAAVLAHETAHVLARHHAERISSLNVFALLRILCWTLLGFGLPQSVMVLGVFLPYSRRAEYEADAIGIRLMARACFDPVAATTMLSKLHSKWQSLAACAAAALRAAASSPALGGQAPLAWPWCSMGLQEASG